MESEGKVLCYTFKCVCVLPAESEDAQPVCWRISARKDYLLLARDTCHGLVDGTLVALLTGLQLDLKQDFGAF